jgi:hypothetical protein
MNLQVQTPAEWLTESERPPLEPVAQFNLTSDDVLVVCGGFEERALGILQNAATSGAAFNVLLINYKPYVPQNKSSAIREICRDSNLHLEETTYDREAPAGFGGVLIESLSNCRGRIYLDVSGMSRLLMVQSLVALAGSDRQFSNCFVTYAEAQEYPPTEEDATAQLVRSRDDPTLSILFLSSGVFEVTVVPELSALASLGEQARLIAFPSLDAHQLTALRNELQPSRLTFIEGEPPRPVNRWRQRIISEINRLDQIPNAESQTTSTLSYEQTLESLLKLYETHSLRERLIVSPTGSKMQTVAVGIFRAVVNDIQIAYPTPLEFCSPGNYTRGVGPLHQLALSPFSPMLGGKAAEACA